LVISQKAESPKETEGFLCCFDFFGAKKTTLKTVIFGIKEKNYFHQN